MTLVMGFTFLVARLFLKPHLGQTKATLPALSFLPFLGTSRVPHLGQNSIDSSQPHKYSDSHSVNFESLKCFLIPLNIINKHADSTTNR